MTLAIWGTLAGVAALLIYAVVQALFYLIDKPDPGTRAKPPQPRRRDRRQAEQARDAVTERLFTGMEVPPEIARDTAPEPLMPLPPGVRALPDDAPHPMDPAFEAWEAANVPEDCGTCGHFHPDGAVCDCGCIEPEDPHDVATPADQADTPVGPVSTPVDTPEPEPLFDTSADHWNDDTLLGLPAVKIP